ncbi:MAG TPA: sigma-54-dependent Fis family transcriptional regulator, partial [Syntrophomonas sp.]|nr:sigma-54-dependent Fis family transcriptional regulator [Syntrophomonas sp.]
MLVNDDKHYRSEIANFLRNSGHRVIEKGDANEALRAFQSADFHLVLADDRMPNMSGIEFLRKIKSTPRGQDADIVVVTAYGNMQTAIETIRAGAYDYLLKPLNIDELIAVIKRVAEHLALKRENKVLKLRFAEAVANATQQTRQELLSLRKAYIEAIGLKNMGF